MDNQVKFKVNRNSLEVVEAIDKLLLAMESSFSTAYSNIKEGLKDYEEGDVLPTQEKMFDIAGSLVFDQADNNDDGDIAVAINSLVDKVVENMVPESEHESQNEIDSWIERRIDFAVRELDQTREQAMSNLKLWVTDEAYDEKGVMDDNLEFDVARIGLALVKQRLGVK